MLPTVTSTPLCKFNFINVGHDEDEVEEKRYQDDDDDEDEDEDEIALEVPPDNTQSWMIFLTQSFSDSYFANQVVALLSDIFAPLRIWSFGLAIFW